MMQDNSYIKKLSRFYADLSANDIPGEVIEKAKMSLMDYLSVYIAGFYKGPLTQKVVTYAKERISKEESTILLSGVKADLENVVLASGLIAHSVELDDGHRYGTAHPAVAVIPAVMALGEKLDSTFGDILLAIIAGYDIMLRLSRSINPSHLKRGFHSTSTTGTIGSAASASVLMGFDGDLMSHSMGIAGLFSSGLQEMLHSNPSVKALQVGRSAQSGISAALFAAQGIKGPISLLEGQHGWIKAMTDSFSENDLMDGLGKRWEIMNTYTKLYPTCRHCHHAIDLAIAAYREGYTIENVKKITIRTYSVGIAEVGIIKSPENLEEAMFSVSYAVAVALKRGYVTIDDLEKELKDKKVLSFSEIMEIAPDEEMDSIYPSERGCVLEIGTDSGNFRVYKTHLPKGEPDTVLSEEEYLHKFKSITDGYVSHTFIDDLFYVIKNTSFHQKPIDKIKGLFEKETGIK